MASNKDLKRAYKLAPKTAGVVAIRNTENGRIFLISSLNLHGVLDRHRFQLEHGSHSIDALQRDWKELGPAAFSFETVETLPVNEDPAYDYSEDLEILEQIWIDTLRPFGEGGYNKGKKVRY